MNYAKFYFLLISLLFAIPKSIAQNKVLNTSNLNLEWSKPLKDSKKVFDTELFAIEDDHVLLIKRSKKDSFFELYNEKNEKINDANLIFPEKKMKFIKLVKTKEKHLLFSSLLDSKNNVNILYVQEFDPISLTLIGERKTLDNFPKRRALYIGVPSNLKSLMKPVHIEVSKDSSKVMAFYNQTIKGKDNESFKIDVLDENMNMIWDKKVSIPYKSKLYDIDDYIVDNSGNVHLLSKLYKMVQREERKGKPNYHYELLSFLDQGDDVKQHKISLKDKFIIGMKVEINLDGTVFCAGFFSNNTSISARGSYFIKFDSATGEKLKETKKDFDLKFLTHNLTKSKKKKTTKKSKKGKKPELFNYVLDDIIIKDDGGIVLIGEQYFMEYHTVSSTGSNGRVTTNQVPYFYYNDIVVINMSKSGGIKWAKKIPKRQISSYHSKLSSYVMHVVKDKIYFIFNDNKKNLEHNFDGKTNNFSRGKNGIAAIVQMDQGGNQSKSSLFNAKDISVLLYPKLSMQVDDDALLLFAQKNKKSQIGKLTFNL